MTRSLPWNIDGIDPEVRHAAQRAARKSGLSIAEWLGEVILTQVESPQTQRDSMDNVDRLESVTRRLGASTRDRRRNKSWAEQTDNEGSSPRRLKTSTRDTHAVEDDRDTGDEIYRARRGIDRQTRDDNAELSLAIAAIARRLSRIENTLELAAAKLDQIAPESREDEEDRDRGFGNAISAGRSRR